MRKYKWEWYKWWENINESDINEIKYKWWENINDEKI